MKRVITDEFKRYGNYIYHNNFTPLRLITRNTKKPKNIRWEERTEEQIQKSKKISLARSKATLKALLLCNLPYGNPKFLTLTYANPQHDEKRAKLDFNKFIKRLKYHTNPKLRYIAVPEEHNSATTRPDRLHSYHFHILVFDLNYLPAKVYSDVWKHGFIKVNRIDNSHMRVASYICKYVTKQDVLQKSSRRFLSSRNVYRPFVFKTYEEIPLLEYESSRRYNRFTGGTVRCDIYKIVN